MALKENSKLKQVEQSTGLCGPASLVSLLHFYGVEKSENELAQLCGSTPAYGTDHENIIRAMQTLGFTVVAKSGGTESDLRELVAQGKPVLVGWYSNFGEMPGDHFSVVYDITETAIFLMDPEIGANREMDIQKFLETWYDYDGVGNILVKGWYLYVV